MGTPVNRRVALARIPQGMPQTNDFTLVDEPLGTPGAGSCHSGDFGTPSSMPST